MDVKITGKNMELGEALQTHVHKRVGEGITKYFDRGADALVTFAKERHMVDCEVTAHLASGVLLSAHGQGGDAYAGFEEALDRLEKRVRRYKRRLKNHHVNGKPALPAEAASYYTLAPLAAEDDDVADGYDADPTPVVVAETSTMLREMTVGAAVMQLDLVDSPALVFKNAAHGRLNVVYRRRDGHIGWIDPSA